MCAHEGRCQCSMSRTELHPVSSLAVYPSPTDPIRAALVRRGLWMNYVSIGYNVLEAVVAVAAGLVAGSVALVGFGFDSVIEVTASVAAQWRLRSDLDPHRRERVERHTARIIGWSFLALAWRSTPSSVGGGPIRSPRSRWCRSSRGKASRGCVGKRSATTAADAAPGARDAA